MQCIGQRFCGWGWGGMGNKLRLGNDLLSTVKMGLGGGERGFAKHGKERGFCKLRIAGPIFRQLHCGTNLFIKIASSFLFSVLWTGLYVMRCVITTV